jgi:hypothetical protein
MRQLAVWFVARVGSRSRPKPIPARFSPRERTAVNTPVNPTVHYARLNRIVIGLGLIILAGIAVFSSDFQIAPDPTGEPFAGDFVQEYMGGHIVLHGDHHRFYDAEYALSVQHDPTVMGMTFGENRYLPMIYPPFYYLLVAPLAILPFHVAALVWLFLMAGCLGGTVWLLANAYSEHPALPAWAFVGALSFSPLLQNLCTSQKGTLALLIVTATFLLLDRGRPFWAGLIFGLIAFKPQLALVIAVAMLCKRQWWFVLGGTVTGVMLVGLSLATSVSACGQYLHLSGSMADFINSGGFPLEKLHCWYGFWKLLLPGSDLRVVQGATLLASGATVAVLTWLLWGRLAYGQPRFAMQFAGLVIATILLSPHLLTYDLTLLLLPFFLLTHLLLTRWPQFAGCQRRVIWLLALLYTAGGASSGLAYYTRLQATVPLLMVLLVTLGPLGMDKGARLLIVVRSATGPHRSAVPSAGL